MYGRNSFELLKAEVLFDELFHDKFNAYVFPAFPGAGGSINDGILDACTHTEANTANNICRDIGKYI